MDEIQRLCSRLKELERGPDQPDARKEVEEALRSKWEGIQVIAGRILARWGGAASEPILRDWLLRTCELHETGTASITHEAAKCYSPFLSPQDASWVINLYFSLSAASWCHCGLPPFGLDPLLDRVTTGDLARRIIAESQSAAPAHRFAAMCAAERIDFRGKLDMFRRLSGDSHKRIRVWAGARLKINKILSNMGRASRFI